MSLQDNIDRAFESQQAFKFQMKNSSADYRIQKLTKMKNLILQRQAQIEQALAKDFAKSPHETTLSEIMPVVAMINLYRKKLGQWMKPKKVPGSMLFMGTQTYVSFEGKGNMLVISPWNYPFQLAMYPVLTAFAAGNTSILKPSEFTPHVNKVITELIQDVFTAEEATVFEGEVETTNLLMDKPFDHVFFTGSTPVGKIIMEKASRHLMSVSLELGGKSPVIIDDDVDMDVTAKRVVWGKHVNGGQTCVAPDYVLISEKNKDKFVRAYKKYVAELYGDSFINNNDYCKIITPRHAARLQGLLKDATDKGAVCEYGGTLFENNKFEPTLITGVSEEMKIMQEEIFGPILPIVVKNSHAEMVQFISKLDNPLSLYLFTDRESVAEYFRQNTNSGSYGVNDTLIHVAHPNLPFGGAGKSGHGRYHGKEGFEEFSNQRAVLKRNFDPGTSYFYPPYTDQKKGIIDKIIKKFNSFI